VRRVGWLKARVAQALVIPDQLAAARGWVAVTPEQPLAAQGWGVLVREVIAAGSALSLSLAHSATSVARQRLRAAAGAERADAMIKGK
jgi:hypothetical protein